MASIPRMPRRLEYAAPGQWGARRRRRMLLTGVAIIVVLSVLHNRWLTPLWHRAQVLYWQRQCMKYSAPPEAVVYAQGVPDHPRSGLWPLPEPWKRLGYQWSCGTVFLHARSKPSGGERLVALDLVPFENGAASPGSTSPQLQAMTLNPGKSDGPKDAGDFYDLGMPLEPDCPVRFFAGQPDPNDRAHFTVGYEINGQKGTIDGWLRNDETVKLDVRDGPAKFGRARKPMGGRAIGE
ncbi:MAG: hypothetical protein JWN24_3246 [Phycisphaerales bacterium]|nr:hypothetical protein [Phycisphaerales bacterium]